jgi:hypothetical protein
MKTLKGTLEFYFATGEQPRPQFVGKKSLDKNGHIQNYDEVYDIAVGDEIRFLHPALKREKFASVDNRFHAFLYYLALMWDQKVKKMEVEYKPSVTTFSWGYHSTKCPHCGAYSGTHNLLCKVIANEGNPYDRK